MIQKRKKRKKKKAKKRINVTPVEKTIKKKLFGSVSP